MYASPCGVAANQIVKTIDAQARRLIVALDVSDAPSANRLVTMRPVGVYPDPSEQVEMLHPSALEAELRGFVCSPQEAAALLALAGPGATLVVPGIRPAGSETGDQKGIATPAKMSGH